MDGMTEVLKEGADMRQTGWLHTPAPRQANLDQVVTAVWLVKLTVESGMSFQIKRENLVVSDQSSCAGTSQRVVRSYQK